MILPLYTIWQRKKIIKNYMNTGIKWCGVRKNPAFRSGGTFFCPSWDNLFWSVVIWVVTPCDFVGGYQRFKGPNHLHLRMVLLKNNYLQIHMVSQSSTCFPLRLHLSSCLQFLHQWLEVNVRIVIKQTIMMPPIFLKKKLTFKEYMACAFYSSLVNDIRSKLKC